MVKATENPIHAGKALVIGGDLQDGPTSQSIKQILAKSNTLDISNDQLLMWRMEEGLKDAIITTSKFKNDKLIRRTVDYQAFTHETLALLSGLDQPS